ncbi:MAG: hypothetical protein PVG07_04115 [Acidobacteriota bacterium]|jgi:hypothetical protein
MSGTADPDGLSDHAYFQAIEGVFVELRGAPLLLSPKDWQTARDWHREGIPLDLVLRTLEEVFERRRERGEDSAVGSLRYCNRAVRAAWKRVRELTEVAAGQPGGGAAGRSPGSSADPALDLPARLDALARALPEDLPGRESLAARIRGLAPPAGEASGEEPEPGPEPAGGEAAGATGRTRPAWDERRVEEALAALDREAVEGLIEGLPEERRRSLDEEVRRSLDALADRLPRDEIGRARERLLAQKVRRLYALPTLSLFAPEAEG